MSDYIAPTFAVVLPNIGGVVGGFVSRANIKTWYAGLKRPSWTPPNKSFSIVWPALYSSMGYASYMVWRDGGGFGGDAAVPLAWYGAQLALNWAWSPIFFGMQSPKWALVDIVCLWGAIAGTVYTFSGVNETAAKIMLPLLGWVSFATALNYKVWKDNPEEKKELKE